jgi:hypothetical protein
VRHAGHEGNHGHDGDQHAQSDEAAAVQQRRQRQKMNADNGADPNGNVGTLTGGAEDASTEAGQSELDAHDDAIASPSRTVVEGGARGRAADRRLESGGSNMAGRGEEG